MLEINCYHRYPQCFLVRANIVHRLTFAQKTLKSGENSCGTQLAARTLLINISNTVLFIVNDKKVT